MSYKEKIAWDKYCRDTQGSMHVADFWWELPEEVKDLYLELTE